MFLGRVDRTVLRCEDADTDGETVTTDSAQLDEPLAKARAASRANEPDKVIEACEKAREIVPDDTRFVFLQGVALQRKGDANGAEPLLRQVIEAAPALAPAHLEHGMALLTQGKLAAARKSLDTAVELQPDLMAAWRALYDVRAAEGDDAGAA